MWQDRGKSPYFSLENLVMGMTPRISLKLQMSIILGHATLKVHHYSKGT
jgi:hypothetical protein